MTRPRHAQRRRALFVRGRHAARSRVRRAALVAVLAAGLPTALALREPLGPPTSTRPAAAAGSPGLAARAPIAGRASAGPTWLSVRDPASAPHASRGRRTAVPKPPAASRAPRVLVPARATAAPAGGTSYKLVTTTVEGSTFRGRATWYGPGFHGRRTASGDVFDSTEMTAAHRTLPFGTKLRVCTRRRCVTVRVNDRGPYANGAVIDLSRAAARRLGIEYAGVARVTVTVIRTRTVRVPVAPPAPPRPAPAAPRRREAEARPRAVLVRTPSLAPAAEVTRRGGGGVLGVALVGGLALAAAGGSVGSVFAVRRRRGLSFVPGVDAPRASGRLDLAPRPIRGARRYRHAP